MKSKHVNTWCSPADSPQNWIVVHCQENHRGSILLYTVQTLPEQRSQQRALDGKVELEVGRAGSCPRVWRSVWPCLSHWPPAPCHLDLPSLTSPCVFRLFCSRAGWGMCLILCLCSSRNQGKLSLLAFFFGHSIVFQGMGYILLLSWTVVQHRNAYQVLSASLYGCVEKFQDWALGSNYERSTHAYIETTSADRLEILEPVVQKSNFYKFWCRRRATLFLLPIREALSDWNFTTYTFKTLSSQVFFALSHWVHGLAYEWSKVSIRGAEGQDSSVINRNSLFLFQHYSILLYLAGFFFTFLLAVCHDKGKVLLHLWLTSQARWRMTRYHHHFW